MEKTVGEKLTILRGQRSRKEVAEAWGVSPSAVAMYEQDNRTPRDEVKVRISKYYGISVGDIFFT